MHITKSAVAVGVVSVGLAGLLAACGGSGSSTVSTTLHARSAPSHIYRVTLTPESSTAKRSGASGDAVIALHDSADQLCWRFAHLHGFTGARSASILASGTVIHLSTSTKLHHQGCRRLTAGVLAAIAQHPGRYTVMIPTAADPKGAISARL
jgi:hypothetical protein